MVLSPGQVLQRNRYEQHHGVRITEEALTAAVELSSGWLPNLYLPDKALDLLDEACARARMRTITAPEELDLALTVTQSTVVEVLSGWVGVSASGLLDELRNGES